MKKKIFLLFLITLFQVSIVACSYVDANKIGLYPAYERDGNTKKWGYIDSQGNFAIKPVYDRTIKFHANGLGKVYDQDKVGFIDTKGKEVLAIEFDNLDIVDEDLFVAEKAEEYFIFNQKGKKLFSTSDYEITGDYNEDFFIIEKELEGGLPAMGFINKNGKETIEPIYEKVFNFNRGKAVAKLYDSNYVFINKYGEIIEELDYTYVIPSNNGEEYLVVDEKNQYGYLDEEGKIMIEPQFTIGSHFEDGYGRVTESEMDSEKKLWGVIDLKGNYIIPPEYTSISYLDEDLFSVSKDKLVSIGSTNFTKQAIINAEGELLTDFDYYSIGGLDGRVKNGVVQVYDGEKTYILDKEGNKIKDTPEIKGEAEIKFDGKVVEVLLDKELSYYNVESGLIWEEDNSFILENQGLVEEKKYLLDNKIKILYPEVKKLKDESIEDKINEKLYSEFIEKPLKAVEDYKEENMILKTIYNVSQENNILIIRKSSYNQKEGSLNGISKEKYYYIDMDEGSFFEFKDLFVGNSDYIERINEKLKEMIQVENKKKPIEYTIDDFKLVKEKQDFILGRENLKIYFQPGEIADVEEGTMSFKIPYEDIEDILYKDSELWINIIQNKGK